MQEALLAAEELAWDKKMSALRQPVNKGPSPGNIQVEQTEDDPEVSQQAHVHVSRYLSLLLRERVCCPWARRRANGYTRVTAPPGASSYLRRHIPPPPGLRGGGVLWPCAHWIGPLTGKRRKKKERGSPMKNLTGQGPIQSHEGSTSYRILATV